MRWHTHFMRHTQFEMTLWLFFIFYWILHYLRVCSLRVQQLFAATSARPVFMRPEWPCVILDLFLILECVGKIRALTPLGKGAENVGHESTQFDCISRQGMRPVVALATATSVHEWFQWGFRILFDCIEGHLLPMVATFVPLGATKSVRNMRAFLHVFEPNGTPVFDLFCHAWICVCATRITIWTCASCAVYEFLYHLNVNKSRKIFRKKC